MINFDTLCLTGMQGDADRDGIPGRYYRLTDTQSSLLHDNHLLGTALYQDGFFNGIPGLVFIPACASVEWHELATRVQLGYSKEDFVLLRHSRLLPRRDGWRSMLMRDVEAQLPVRFSFAKQFELCGCDFDEWGEAFAGKTLADFDD